MHVAVPRYVLRQSQRRPEQDCVETNAQFGTSAVCDDLRERVPWSVCSSRLSDSSEWSSLRCETKQAGLRCLPGGQSMPCRCAFVYLAARSGCQLQGLVGLRSCRSLFTELPRQPEVFYGIKNRERHSAVDKQHK